MARFTHAWFQLLIVIHIEETLLNVHEIVNVYEIAEIGKGLGSNSVVKVTISGENEFGDLWAVFK